MKTEHTEIRIGYDDQFLYVSGKMFDSEPAGIRANSMYRDLYSGDDTFALIVDTFNDRENALWFMTTPNGIRLDLAISNDGEMGGGGTNRAAPFGRNVSSSWNTYWDVATTRTAEGWFAEMRIPFSSLGFQDRNGVVEMGISAHRYIARKNERHVFPAVPPNWMQAFLKPSLFQAVRLRGARSQRPLYVTPYAAGGLSQVNALNPDGTAYVRGDDATGDVGVDLKYNLTSNLTLDLTVNTDFAQAESDDEQVNLTRFSLFFPEKRQFFQERAGLFDFRTQGRDDRLFNTRQIGLYEGQTIPIIAGARMVGRVGKWDMGLIDMQTARHTLLPSENFGVFRFRRQVLNANSYGGGMFTSRLGEDGSSNYAYGLDAIVRVGAAEYMEIKWAQSFDDSTNNGRGYAPSQTGYGRARIERRGVIGLSYIALVTWQGADFNPGIGFVSRTDFVQPFFRVSYGWFAGESSRIRSLRPGLFANTYVRNADGVLESGMYQAEFEMLMKSGDMHTLQIETAYEDLREPVDFPENTLVPAGDYLYPSVQWEFRMRDGSLLRTNAQVTAGAFFDGWNVGIQAEPTWNVSRLLELGATYQFNRVRFPERQEEFYVHLARVRAQLGFTTRMSLSTFLQYNTSTDSFTSNFRFRYNFREGSDLWLVYNEGRFTDRYAVTPILPELDFRTVLVKYTYTFIR
ncbi:MAG: DUF5916 domain-containing protein [Rhodothermales bacterium]|nr:DUF5916 domain-containing protein [Rhodothermales bacterium]